MTCIRQMRPLIIVSSYSVSLLAVISLAASSDAREGEKLAALKPAVTALAITPDGGSYLVGSQAGVERCVITRGPLTDRPFPDASVASIPTELEQILALSFSPDGRMLATAGGTPAVTGIVELRSWPELELVARLEGHEDVVYSVAWLPRHRALATAGADGTIQIWDRERRRSTTSLVGHSGPVLAVTVSPDGRWLCSGSVDATIRVWDTETWRMTRTLNNHLDTVHGVAFRPRRVGDQHPCLASASEDGTVRIWYPDIGRMVRIIRHGVPVFSLAWNPSGEHLFTGAKDGCLRLLGGEDQRIQESHRLAKGWLISLVVHRGGRRILAGTSHGTVQFFRPGRRARF